MNAWSSKKVRGTWGIVLAAIVAFSLMPAMHRGCVKYLDGWAKKSIGTVVVASGVSAGLSVIEDSELQVSVFGTGASVALGDSVRPLNEMVGRVITVAMASTVSLGIQKLLVDIGASVGFKLLLLLAVASQLMALWVDRHLVRQVANGLLAFALLATFAIPSAVLLTGLVGDRFTEVTYAKAQAEMNKLSATVKKVDPKSVSSLGDRLKSTAAAYSEYAVTYIVVFVVQTMLMPLLVLWGLVKAVGFLLAPASAVRMEARLLAAIRGGKGPDDKVASISEPSADGASA